MTFLKSENKIIKLIYENPGIRLSELIKKAGVSAATAKKRLNSLRELEVINEKSIVGGKRVLIKNFYPNLSSEEGKSVFSLIESGKKQEFFKKNKSLISPFKQLLRNINSEIKIVLIFGSFAKFAAEKDSDLDILFLTDEKIKTKQLQQLKKEIERSFVTFAHEVEPRTDTLDNLKKNIDKGIYQTIIKEHVIIKGALDYIELIKETKNSFFSESP